MRGLRRSVIKLMVIFIMMMIGLRINFISMVVHAYNDDSSSSSSSSFYSTTSSSSSSSSSNMSPSTTQFPHPYSDGFKIPCKVRKVITNPKIFLCSARCSALCVKHLRKYPKYGSCISGCVEEECVGRKSSLFACTFGCTKSIVTKFGLYDQMGRMEGYMNICYNNCKEN